MPCRALEAFRQQVSRGEQTAAIHSLNALSGIGGVQTLLTRTERGAAVAEVLMPCRALEAFRQGGALRMALMGH